MGFILTIFEYAADQDRKSLSDLLAELEQKIKGSGTFAIDQYVVINPLDGFFHVLGEEERKIRTNPAARVTDLLKEVFGK